MNPQLAFAVLCFLCGLLVPRLAFGGEPSGTDIRRAIHLLGYVAIDYGGAVRGGKVIDQSELDEQLGFLREASSLLTPPANPKALAAVQRAQAIANAHGEPAELASVLGGASKLLQVTIRLVPPQAPSMVRGQTLFEQHCATCHGLDGSAQTPAAEQLKPPPADLLDPRIAEALSPARVALAIEFGIPGTAMVARPDLTEQERWDVAFYASSLPYRSGESLPRGPAFLLEELSTLSNRELRSELLAAGAKIEEVESILGYNRAQAPTAGALPTRLGSARASLRKARVLLPYDQGAAKSMAETALGDLEQGLVELHGRSAPESEQLADVISQLRSALTDGLADPLNRALIVSLRLDPIPPKQPAGASVWPWCLLVLVVFGALVVALLRRRSSQRVGV